MKFKIELDIDWIEQEFHAEERGDNYEEVSIDEMVSSELKHSIIQEVSKAVSAEFKDQLKMACQKYIETKFDGLLEEEFVKTVAGGFFMRNPENAGVLRSTTGDSSVANYNSVQHEPHSKIPSTPQQILHQRMELFMADKMRSGKNRFDELLDSAGERQVENFISKLSDTVIQGIKEDISAEALKTVSETIVKSFDTSKMVSRG
jgi:alpha-glucuronidase